MFEIKPKSKEIVHFYLTLLSFLMKTVMFSFSKVHFLLSVQDTLKQKCFRFLDLCYLVDNLSLPISADIEIFLHSISNIHKAKQFTHYLYI